jgi:hypothetical protein
MDANNLFKAALQFGGAAFNAFNDNNNHQNNNNDFAAKTARLQNQIKFCTYPNQYIWVQLGQLI